MLLVKILFIIITLVYNSNGEINILLNNYGWLENLNIDCNDNSLYVSDFNEGYLIQIKNYNNITYHWKGLYQHLLGITVDTKRNLIYVGGVQNDGTNVIIKFSSNLVNEAKIFAKLPNHRRPNGLGVHLKSGFVYVSTEGDQLPNDGYIFEIENNGNVNTFSKKLWSADGLFIDQTRHILYVGQLWNNKIARFNLSSTNEFMDLSKDHHFGLLDDFTLAGNYDQLIVGANWLQDRLVVFPSNPFNTSSYQTVLKDLRHPTSARFGCGNVYNSTSLFITEAGDITKKNTARLIEYTNFPYKSPEFII